MLEWVFKGGPMMAPILLCSVLVLMIIIERFMYLKMTKADKAKFMDEVSNSLKRNRLDEAIGICEGSPGPVPNIIKAGILKYDRSRAEIREAIEEAALREIPKFEKNIAALATIAHISPLLGFLGTALGMIEVFQRIQAKSAALSPITPVDLSGGIWQALIAPVAGLIVAIPALTAYNYFVTKVNNIILEIEIGSTDLINILSEKKGE